MKEKMKCKYLTKRNRKYRPYFYCRSKRREIILKDCQNCSERDYKSNKSIKNKSKKLAKKERNRTSILQRDKTYCFLCNRVFKEKDLDKHEAFGGCNRQKSIEWSLIYYLCRICHKKADEDKKTRQLLHNIAREAFIKRYGEEKFLEEFKKNYFEEE